MRERKKISGPFALAALGVLLAGPMIGFSIRHAVEEAELKKKHDFEKAALCAKKKPGTCTSEENAAVARVEAHNDKVKDKSGLAAAIGQ